MTDEFDPGACRIQVLYTLVRSPN